MALKHDEQGFLIGEPIDLDHLKKLVSIERHVAAIHAAVVAKRNAAPKVSQSTVSPIAQAASARTYNRYASGKFVKSAAAKPVRSQSESAMTTSAIKSLAQDNGNKTIVASPVPQTQVASTAQANPVLQSDTQVQSASSVPLNAQNQTAKAVESQSRQVAKLTKSVEKALPKRGTNRQFLGGGEQQVERGLIARTGIAVLDRLSGVGIADGVENIDLSIQAAREIAKPIRSGLEIMGIGSGEKNQTSWLRKIFRTLNVFQKEETSYNKAAKKSLKAIEDKPVGVGGRSSSGGGFSFGEATSMGLGGWLMSKFGKASKVAEGVPGKLGLLGRMGKMGKGLLRRLPWIGALFAAGEATAGVLGNEDSDVSRLDKDKANGKSIGGAGGSLAGGVAGAIAGSVFGPIGTVVGGVVGSFLGDQAGQIIGDKFGEWVNVLRDADVAGYLKSSWDSVSSQFDEVAKWLQDSASTIGDFFGEQADIANNYVKANTGFDFLKASSEAVDKAKDVGSKALSFISDTANSASEMAGKGLDWASKNTTVGKAVSRASNLFSGGNIPSLTPEQAAALAAETRRTESGGNLSAENKYGYIGSYQFGADALSDVGYIDAQKWKDAKRRGIGQGRFLADNANWKIEGGKNAYLSSQQLQDEGFSKLQSRYFSAGIRSGALKEGDTPEKIAGYLKTAHLLGPGGANKYFKHGINGADANGTRASTYAAQGASAIASVEKTLPMASVPKAPTVPVVPPAPQNPTPLTSLEPPEFTVNMPSQDASQNVGDRMTAHLVSGGIGQRGPY